MSRSPHAERFARCQANGLTAPETAMMCGTSETAVYRWAQRSGLRFANRKVPPKMTAADNAKRAAAHRAMLDKLRDRAVNGWTWAQLLDAGFTAPEAARLRGQTVAAAYAAERVHGRKFYRVHIKGMSTKERHKMHRVRRDYGVSRDTALEVLRRGDLIQPRASERVRQLARIKHDPEAALIEMMRASAPSSSKSKAHQRGSSV